MGFFLVKSPLALAIGQAIIAAGSVVEMPDDEGAHLVANGTLEQAEIDPEQAEAFAQAKADAGIDPNEVMVATPEPTGEDAATVADEAPPSTPKPSASKKGGKA